MEKYFVVEDEKLIEEFREYKDRTKFYRESYNKLQEEFGIEAKLFVPSDPLQIRATQNDYKNFSEQFAKSKSGERCQFKVKTEVGKRWRKLVGETPSPMYPWLVMHSISGVELSSIMNEIDGVVYMNISSDSSLCTPDTLVEIKGSEYHKIFEEYENRRKGE